MANKCPGGILSQALLKWWLWDQFVVIQTMYFFNKLLSEYQKPQTEQNYSEEFVST